MKSLREFFSQNFTRKLILFTLSGLILTTLLLFTFLVNNFRTITAFSLEQNTASMEQTVEDYLTKYTQEKAFAIWLQLKSAQDNMAILGKTAQKIVDHYDEIQANPAILELSLFQTELQSKNGALTSDPDSLVDTLIPPAIAGDPRAAELLRASALLNLNIEAVYDANINNAFVYFVGSPETPVTRAYPNIHLVEVLGDGLNLLFWRDYFAQNVAGWTKWYTDPALRERVSRPITVEPPYADAAGQGLMVTMFYPLWDQKQNEFAGAVGADITLAKIVENVLSIRVAKTGFAFLMNGAGEIIAMPEAGFQLFKVNLTRSEQGGLSYYTGQLSNSEEAVVRDMVTTILASEEGVMKIRLGVGQEAKGELVTYASLPSLSNNQYEEDHWKVVLVVSEAEIFEALYATDRAIRNQSLRISLISLVMVITLLVILSWVTIRFARSITRDIRLLAGAAEQISAKNYDIDLRIESKDEIGQLGRVFQNMTHEIRDYTINLEKRVAERTADLKNANDEISRLNGQLKDENLRLGAELDVARRLQMMMLPPEREVRAVPDLDIACYMRPADEVGGDYYDVLRIGDVVYLGIGDVTGHGLSAGVVMLMAQTSLLTLSQSGEQDMNRILSVMNQVLYRNILRIREEKNMTLAVLEYKNRQFKIAGQHESVLICRGNGAVEVIDTMDLGFPMGLEDNIDPFIATRIICMEPGEVMLLYTDGVTEAENEQRKQFGLPHLIDQLRMNSHLNADELLKRLTDTIYSYIGSSPIYDDISLLVIKQK